jgi:hypothetical protein
MLNVILHRSRVPGLYASHFSGAAPMQLQNSPVRLGKTMRYLCLLGAVTLISLMSIFAQAQRTGASGAEQALRSARSIDLSTSPEGIAEGAWVHLAGKVETGMLGDPLLDAPVAAVKLVRVVQMLQWRQEEHGSKPDTYTLVWSEQPISSAGYDLPFDRTRLIFHRNPRAEDWPFTSTNSAGKAMLGQFQLTNKQLAGLDETALQLPEVPQALQRQGFVLAGKGQYIKRIRDVLPTPGDLNVFWRVVPPQDMTLLGVKQGNQLTPSSDGFGLQRNTKMPLKALLANNQQSGAEVMWIIRILLGLMLFGVLLLVRWAIRKQVALGAGALPAQSVGAILAGPNWQLLSISAGLIALAGVPYGAWLAAALLSALLLSA